MKVGGVIYLVSGFMRSGTSMMMKALHTGGMDVAFSAERDKRLNDKWGEGDVPDGYRPNDEYYELDTKDYSSPNFPGLYEGKLIKCLWSGAERLPPRDYRIVCMRRPRAEIATSCLAAFGHVPKIVQPHDFDQFMDAWVERLRDRRSFQSVSEVWYSDVMASPETVFAGLVVDGWPIDAAEAASVPSAGKVRFAA